MITYLNTEAWAKATDAILNAIATDNADFIKCLKVAGEHVSTMHTETRMRLRDFIAAQGVSLNLPTASYNQPDKSGAAFHPVGPTAIPMTEAKPGFCCMPVGEFNSANPADSMCCGAPTSSGGGPFNVFVRYCDDHIDSVANPESRMPAKPHVIPRSKAYNYAARNRKNGGFDWRA